VSEGVRVLEASPYVPLALVEDPRWPPTWWRIVRPFVRLRQCGVPAQFEWRDGVGMAANPDSTILVIQQQTGPDIETARAWLEARRPYVRAVVYETDDDVFTEDRLEHLQAADFMQGKTADEIRREMEVARAFVDLCDGVTVSTEPLAEVVRSFTDTPVHVVPNALDVRWFRSQMLHRPHWADTLTIGWAGGHRSERDIVPMARAWGRIAARYPDVRFVVCAPTTIQAIYRYVPEGRIIRLPWLGIEDYPAAYQVDIGCCAVRDTPFNRTRSPIKAWEYATAGAAVVATPTVYGETHAVAALAETAGEWEDALVRLLDDDDWRRHAQGRGARLVEREHSLDVQLPTWVRAYQQIVEQSAGVTA
jgi:glycosyltransferase involved in cell wall biosynthesis